MTDQIKISFAAGSDRGKVREQNQDSVLISKFEHSDVILLQVADGVGGYAGGEVASKLTVEVMQASVAKAILLANSGAGYASDWLEATLQHAIKEANLQLIKQQSLLADLADMATTIVAMLIHNNSLVIGHLGDSRCYQLNNNHLTQLTEDHTALQKLLNEGKINQQEFEVLPMHHVISQAVGLIKTPEIKLHKMSLKQHSCYLLCSDGLTNCVSDAQIQHILNKKNSLENLVDELIVSANDNGGADNISVVIMKSN